MARIALRRLSVAALTALALSACGTDDGASVRNIDGAGEGSGSGSNSGTHTGSASGTHTGSGSGSDSDG